MARGEGLRGCTWESVCVCVCVCVCAHACLFAFLCVCVFASHACAVHVWCVSRELGLTVLLSAMTVEHGGMELYHEKIAKLGPDPLREDADKEVGARGWVCGPTPYPIYQILNPIRSQTPN